MCDYPYFSDFNKKKTGVFVRRDIPKTEFTLPGVFTKRTTKADIFLSGEMPCEPVVRLFCSREYESAGGGITVKNNSNGNFFTLNYKMSRGEEITVDFHSRTVKNQLGKSLINHISEDTFLSEFKLEPGTNEIEVVNGEDAEAVSAVIEFGNIYAEAAL